MAPLLFKEMKGVNFACVSPASAAVCSSIDRKSMVRPTIIAKSIDQRLSDLRDPRRSRPYSEKSRKSLDHRLSTATTRTSTKINTSACDHTSPRNSSRYLRDDTAFFDVYPELEPLFEKPKSSISIDLKVSSSSPTSSPSSTSSPVILTPLKENESSPAVVRRSCVSSARHSAIWAQSLASIDSPKASTALRPSNSTISHHEQVWFSCKLKLFISFLVSPLFYLFELKILIMLLLLGGGVEGVTTLQRLWRQSEEAHL